jgi:hypothetical protein
MIFLAIFYLLCAFEIWLFLRSTPRLTSKSFSRKINTSIVLGLFLLLFAWFATPFSDITDRKHHDPHFWWWVPTFTFVIFGLPYFLFMGLLRYLICLAEHRHSAAQSNRPTAEALAKPAS